jgi:ApaG protein
MSDTTTRGVRIVVSPRYVPEQSNPTHSHFLFAYHVIIENRGERTVQLLSRHWIITDGENRVEEVRGEGVVGEQPTLAPGERFEYTSGCPLATPIGTMHGSYTMRDVHDDIHGGETFEADILPFRLAVPRILN